MTKYRIKEYQGKFTVQVRQYCPELTHQANLWNFRAIFNKKYFKEIYYWIPDIQKGYAFKCYDDIKQAQQRIDEIIKMNSEPKYHYYPEETK